MPFKKAFTVALAMTTISAFAQSDIKLVESLLPSGTHIAGVRALELHGEDRASVNE